MVPRKILGTKLRNFPYCEFVFLPIFFMKLAHNTFTTQFGNLMTFLPLIFYVKSISENLYVQKLPSFAFLGDFDFDLFFFVFLHFLTAEVNSNQKFIASKTAKMAVFGIPKPRKLISRKI